MYNYIKSKALVVHKRNVLRIFLCVLSMLTMVACDSKEEQVTTKEFELVSCYIEYRNITNRFGGVRKTEEYLHYAYVDDNGQVVFDKRYDGTLSSEFQVTEGTPKLIITTSRNKTTYTFQLTREMYSNLNSSQ